MGNTLNALTEKDSLGDIIAPKPSTDPHLASSPCWYVMRDHIPPRATRHSPTPVLETREAVISTMSTRTPYIEAG